MNVMSDAEVIEEWKAFVCAAGRTDAERARVLECSTRSIANYKAGQLPQGVLHLRRLGLIRFVAPGSTPPVVKARRWRNHCTRCKGGL